MMDNEKKYREDLQGAQSKRKGEGTDSRVTAALLAALLIGILVCLFRIAGLQASVDRMEQVSPYTCTDVKELHGLTPGKDYSIKTSIKNSEGKMEETEGSFTFTAKAADQTILVIYDEFGKEFYYKLIG